MYLNISPKMYRRKRVSWYNKIKRNNGEKGVKE